MTDATPELCTTPALLRAIVDDLPIGVVILDHDGRVLCVNRYEREMAQRYAADAVGRNFFGEVAPCMDVRGLAGAFWTGIGRGAVQIETELSFRFEHLPKPRDVRLSIRSFDLHAQRFAAVCLQDVTVFREAERRRDVLAASIVHDLRSPLAGVAAEIDFALHRRDIDSTLRALLDSARAGIDRTARLATTLLELRRLVSDDEVSAAAALDVDLVLLANATVRALASLARAQGVSLVVAGDGTAPLRCDATLIRRALENLIDNGLRAAPEGTVVTVTVSRTTAGARLSVADHGPGVAAELRDAIFDPGFTTGGRCGHFGLGLALVSLVARRHGGRASVEETPGGGATFVLELSDAGSDGAGP